MRQHKWLTWGIVCLAIGSFYEFTPRAIIKNISPLLIWDVVILGKRIRQNDLILIASILLIFGVVFCYKWWKTNKE